MQTVQAFFSFFLKKDGGAYNRSQLLIDYLVVALLKSMFRRNKNKPDDHALVAACRRGEKSALRQLYEQNYRTMYGVCLRYCRSSEDAQDVLQDAFVKVFDRLGDWQGSGSLAGWIRRIVVGTAIDRYRSLRPELALRVEEPDWETSDEAATVALPDEGQAEVLAAAIRALPDRCRLVFNLFAIEGYSHAEIAAELNITEGTSKSQLAYARKQLQATLQPILF